MSSAVREIKFHFPKLILEPLANPSAATDYITAQLQPALAKVRGWWGSCCVFYRKIA